MKERKRFGVNAVSEMEFEISQQGYISKKALLDGLDATMAARNLTDSGLTCDTGFEY